MSRGSKEEIFGERIFRGVSNFFGDVVFKKHMTLYAPIPSEPSLGTPHPHVYTITTTGAAAAGNYYEADFVAQVPAGTKEIVVC